MKTFLLGLRISSLTPGLFRKDVLVIFSRGSISNDMVTFGKICWALFWQAWGRGAYA